MTFEQFHEANENLKAYFLEQDKLDAVLKVISPTSTGVCEFGSKFIDDYIKVVEIALCDEDNWYSWFVFDNDFGREKLRACIKNEWFEIETARQFYDYVTVLNAI